ncbi:MAG: alpha/beta fold hydrolase [Lachnospiraceae bacterium]
MKYIFLHGLGQTAASWDETIGCLEGKEDVFCPDLFELIREKEIVYGNLYEAFSEYCAAVSESVSEPLAICGLSLGGILALQYTIENPGKVKSLVLIGTQFVMPKGLLKFQNTVFRFMPPKLFDGMGLKKRDTIKLSESMLELDFSQTLKAVQCQTLVICGEKDRANRKAVAELANRLPRGELKIIENAGHEVNVDAPEELGTALNAFWKMEVKPI